MSSIGLALVQGEKNATELAMSKIAAIANMAKSAREADMANEYWDPTRAAERERVLKEAEDTLAGKERFDKYAKDMSKDPVATSALIFKDKGYGMMSDGAGGYIVYNPETSDQIHYPTKELLSDAAVEAVVGTPASTLSKIKTIADAQRAMMNKAWEKDQENMSYARFIGDPKNRSAERVAGIGAGATVTGHRIDAEGRIIAERTRNELPAEKVESLIDNASFEATGIYKNKDGQYVGTIKNTDGTTSEIPFNSMPIEQQQSYLKSRQNIRQGITTAIQRGFGALQGPALAAQLDAEARTQAEAEKRRIGIDLGLPTASNPDQALSAADRYTKPVAPRKSWYNRPLPEVIREKTAGYTPDYTTGVY